MKIRKLFSYILRKTVLQLALFPPHGYDAGKKIKGKGKKRHVLVDTQGLMMHALVHAADIQDRDGGVVVMATLFGLYPFLMKLYADGGYQGPQFQKGLKTVLKNVSVEIVKRSDRAKGFVVLPKRWVASLGLHRVDRNMTFGRRTGEHDEPLDFKTDDIEAAGRQRALPWRALARGCSEREPSHRS